MIVHREELIVAYRDALLKRENKPYRPLPVEKWRHHREDRYI